MRINDLFEQITPRVTRLRGLLPKKLVGRIPDNALLAAYQSLVAGHNPGNVRSVGPRRPAEALMVLQDTLKKLAGCFSGFDHPATISIYRGVTVSPDWVEGLRHPGNALGLHWSLTESYVMDRIDDEDEDEEKYVVLAAEVGPESIDWAATLPELADGVEDEIVLLARAPVTLRYIEPSPEWTPADQQIA